MENLSTENLFRKIAFNDDQQAFRSLFFDFYPALCVFAGRYIDSPETCEDIVQDTFFHLWQHRKNIEITSSFRNLLVTSVKNNCLDYLRKRDVRQRYAENHAFSETIDSPEEIYTMREIERILHSALEKLPENIRRAFELSRYQNMTYNQIAQEMNVSPKTVESYLGKALRMLRSELKDYLPLAILFFPHIFKN